MKKVFFIALAFGALTLTSCKKDWSCECSSGGNAVTSTIKDMTHKDAKEQCDKGDFSGFGVELECKLK
ncbi:MAG: hypothetical protein R2779_08495 [Crocinitomicaceae bacterium]